MTARRMVRLQVRRALFKRCGVKGDIGCPKSASVRRIRRCRKRMTMGSCHRRRGKTSRGPVPPAAGRGHDRRRAGSIIGDLQDGLRRLHCWRYTIRKPPRYGRCHAVGKVAPGGRPLPCPEPWYSAWKTIKISHEEEREHPLLRLYKNMADFISQRDDNWNIFISKNRSVSVVNISPQTSVHGFRAYAVTLIVVTVTRGTTSSPWPGMQRCRRHLAERD